MIHTCKWCGTDFDHTMSARGGRNCWYCSDECRHLAKAETLRVYNRKQQSFRVKHTFRPVLVTYPDVAYVDRWTREDWMMYKGDLPAGATVEFTV